MKKKYSINCTFSILQLLLFSCSILIFNSCNSHNNKISDLENSNIHGKVKTTKSSWYNIEEKFGEINKGDLTVVYITEYNEDGFWKEMKNYLPNGEIDSRSIRRFDENGNEVEQLRYDSDGKLELKFSYTIDENGNQIKLDWYKYNRLHSKSNYKFDKEGNELERNQYDSNGDFWYGDKNKYDGNGNRIEEISSNSDGVISIDKWKYSNNKMIESNHYNPDGKLTIKNTYNYDNNDKLIERNLYNEDGSLSQKWNYKYDEYENISESFHIVTRSNEEVREKYDYEYDEKKNWTKCQIIRNGTPSQICEREIEYY